MEDLPPPLVPAECDLRGFGYMPLHTQHLLGSMFNLTATDAEFRAGLNLFMQSWSQKPAGSLPQDERALAVLAGLGPDVARWAEVRAVALRNWVLCSDGRLYHPFLCEQALVAMKTRTAARERKEKWKSKKEKSAKDGSGTVPEPFQDANGTDDETGRDVTSCPSNDGHDVTSRSREVTQGVRHVTSGPRESPMSRAPSGGGKAQKTEQPLARKKASSVATDFDNPHGMWWMNDPQHRDEGARELGMPTQDEWVRGGRPERDYNEALQHAWLAARKLHLEARAKATH